MSKYSDYQAWKRAEYGDKFDTSDLAAEFLPYFNSGERIKVRTTYPSGETYDRTGTVGITSGWKPAWLLMHRSSDHSSSDVLGPNDHVVCTVRKD